MPTHPTTIAPRLFHTDEGQGQAVLFLHGLPSPPEDLRVASRELSVRALVPDLPGYGQSPAGPGRHGVAAIEDDLVALLVEANAQDAVLVGFSMGAYRALSLALRPELRPRALVLLAGFADLDAEQRAGFRALAPMLREGVDVSASLPAKFLSPHTLATRPDAAIEVASWAKAASATTLAEELEDAASLPSLVPRLHEIRLPVLVRTGTLDLASPPAAARVLGEAIAGATLQIVPEVAHALLIEDREATLAAVRSFLGVAGR